MYLSCCVFCGCGFVWVHVCLWTGGQSSTVDVITHVLFTLLLFNYLFGFLSECFAYIYVQHVHALRVERPEEGIGYPRPRIMGGCESPCGCWEQNLNHLQEQQTLLATEPLLQPQLHNLKIFCYYYYYY